jgi:FAD:protein FMN transferase
MGTAIGIDVRDPGVSDAAVDDAFVRLAAIEARFSTYRSDSEVSRYGRAEFREVLRLCEAVRISSGGAFDVRHRADGLVDPSGLVKGWAVDEAAAVLERHGARNYTINAGGDVLAHGEPSPGRAWRVGVQHPQIREAMAAVFDVRDLAVATSGAYQRGDHIIDPNTGAPPTGMLSVTVAGPSLAFADAYATAAFAMGADGIRWIAALSGYAGCAITTDGRFVWTNAFEPLLVRSETGAPPALSTSIHSNAPEARSGHGRLRAD